MQHCKGYKIVYLMIVKYFSNQLKSVFILMLLRYCVLLKQNTGRWAAEDESLCGTWYKKLKNVTVSR